MFGPGLRSGAFLRARITKVAGVPAVQQLDISDALLGDGKPLSMIECYWRDHGAGFHFLRSLPPAYQRRILLFGSQQLGLS